MVYFLPFQLQEVLDEPTPCMFGCFLTLCFANSRLFVDHSRKETPFIRLLNGDMGGHIVSFHPELVVIGIGVWYHWQAF